MKITFKYIIFLIHLTLVIGHWSFPAFALTSTDLIENARQHDGQIVEYQGEAIGDIMVRGNYAWINVNDGNQAIGIWADSSMVRALNNTGSYRYVGDTVRVIGTFHRACEEHGGDLDIHAREFYVVNQGRRIELPLHRDRLWIAVFLLIGIMAVLVVSKIIKPRA